MFYAFQPPVSFYGNCLSIEQRYLVKIAASTYTEKLPGHIPASQDFFHFGGMKYI